MDHCWESAAHSACFQIRSHQDMPTHSCCDKGAGLHADHAVLWRYRSAACAWPEPLKIRLMDGALQRQEWTDRTWGMWRKEKRCMFVFRLSWIECLDFGQLIIQQILKGINEVWRFQRRDYCCYGSQEHTTTYSCHSVYLFTLFTTSPHSSRSAMMTWEVIFIIYLFIFLRKQKITFVAPAWAI